MKNSNIIRSIFWGVILLIVLSLGIIGLIYNNQIFSERKNDLTNIIDTFNKSETILNYKKVNSEIYATLKGKNINIEYDGVETKNYTYTLKNGYLETTLDKSDPIGKVILMVLTDSIAVYHNEPVGNTYPLFNNDDVLNYTLNDGIEYKEFNNKYIIKISLDSYIINYNNIIDDDEEENYENEENNILNDNNNINNQDNLTNSTYTNIE